MPPPGTPASVPGCPKLALAQGHGRRSREVSHGKRGLAEGDGEERGILFNVLKEEIQGCRIPSLSEGMHKHSLNCPLPVEIPASGWGSPSWERAVGLGIASLCQCIHDHGNFITCSRKELPPVLSLFFVRCSQHQTCSSKAGTPLSAGCEHSWSPAGTSGDSTEPCSPQELQSGPPERPQNGDVLFQSLSIFF